MKVTVLGGAGTVGSMAVMILASSKMFSEVVIGDVNYDKAKKLASEIGLKEVSTVKVDVEDLKKVKEAIQGSDVVLSCVGPFYRFAPIVLRASIKAGVNHVDICDDVDATEVLLKMDSEAKKAGISALIGMGSYAISLLAPLLMTLFFFQGMRAYVVGLYVTIWNIVLIPGSPMLPMLTVLVFAFPLLALVIARKVASERLAVTSSIFIPILALALALSLSYELELLLSSLLVGFYGIFFPFYLAYKLDGNSAQRSNTDLVLFTCGFALAVSYDVLVRTLGSTYDVGANSALLPVQIALAIAGVVLWVLMHQESLQTEKRRIEAGSASAIGGVLIPSGIGMILFLELAILANPNTILRYAQPNYSLAQLSILVPSLALMTSLAALVVAIPYLRSTLAVQAWRAVLCGNLVVLVAVASLLFEAGWFSAVLALLAQFFITFDLYVMLRYSSTHQFRWERKSILATSFFLALLIFLLWNFMYGFAYAYAFLGFIGTVFRDQLPAILLSATLILLLTSTLAAYHTHGEREEMRKSESQEIRESGYSSSFS